MFADCDISGENKPASRGGCRRNESLPTFAPVLPSHIVAGMSASLYPPGAEPYQYVTPCGRYFVERTGVERYEVHGPDGFIDWFVTLADAKLQADWLAEQNPVKQTRCRRRSPA